MKLRTKYQILTATVLNTKISEVENKIPNHHEYVTSAEEFNKLTPKKLTARLKQSDLVSKTNFDKKLTSFNKRVTSNETEYLEVQKKLNSLITKDYDIF